MLQQTEENQQEYKSIQDVVRDLEQNPVEARGHMYHRIPFPEFDHLSTSSSESAVEEKWQVIKTCCDELFESNYSDRRILDIGSNGGFYSFQLARLGAQVTSFENHPRYSKIGSFLAGQSNQSVVWHPTAFDPGLIEGTTFDAALLLSVFQWMCAGNETDEASLQQLRYVSDNCRYLFFELGYNSGKCCLRTRRINHYAHLVNFLRRHTSYKHFQLLGKTQLWGRNRRFLILCSNDRTRDDTVARKLVRYFHV